MAPSSSLAVMLLARRPVVCFCPPSSPCRARRPRAQSTLRRPAPRTRAVYSSATLFAASRAASPAPCAACTRRHPVARRRDRRRRGRDARARRAAVKFARALRRPGLRRVDAVRAVVRWSMTTELLLVVLERPGLLLQARHGSGDLAAAATTSKRLYVYSMRRIQCLCLILAEHN